MREMVRRTFLFAAGALTAAVSVPAVVKVAARVTAPPVLESSKMLYYAILAEGTQWEVRVSGWPGAEGPWYVDVPPAMQNLDGMDRLRAVDRIMTRITEAWQKDPKAQIANPLPRIGHNA